MGLLRGSRRPDQRGAVAVVVAVMLSLLLIAAAFAVDLNMQRVAARDAQAAADLIALDMARELDGSKRSDYDDGALRTAFEASVARNAEGFGADVDDFTYDLVVAQGAGGWAVAGADEHPDAVRVRAVGSVDRLFTSGTGGVVRRAVATSDNSACFRVGSFIAGLDTAESALLGPILNALLGSSVQLDAVSYQGLAGANVSLLSLVETGALGVGTVDELLELPALRVADLFLASATVLDRQGNAVQADVLRTIAADVGTPTVAVGNLVSAAPGANAALEAGLNVLDLVTSSAFLIQDGRTVAVPNLGITLPGVASITSSLTVVEPMKTACRRTGGEVETSQVRLDLTATINPSAAIAGVNGLLSTVGNLAQVEVEPTTLELSVDLGQAIARLGKVECDDDGPSSMTLDLQSSVVGGISVSATTGLGLRVNNPVSSVVNLLQNLLGLGNILGDLLGTNRAPYLVLDAGVEIHAGAGAAEGWRREVTLPLPGSYEVAPAGARGTAPVLGPLSVSTTADVSLVSHYFQPGPLGIGGSWRERTVLDTAPLFGAVVNPILSRLTANVLNPVVQGLQTQVIGPLAELLGLQLGGADVYAVRTPGCSVPNLVG
ncbi:hypothetical protein RDV89_12390 [Nocardioides zeae]|uniref:Flp pilus-assembly TadG-like N-terminal domain-containing protein n=1 Tax=Nocardioides imazamoxiresistens TaxID=3231893 RepID=A0ABU3PXB5_9ACTN|nr:hypothetical protein [Nocardioides zeae]MDT9593873.1 hypothetical protein [Nocardioides zeae]